MLYAHESSCVSATGFLNLMDGMSIKMNTARFEVWHLEKKSLAGEFSMPALLMNETTQWQELVKLPTISVSSKVWHQAHCSYPLLQYLLNHRIYRYTESTILELRLHTYSKYTFFEWLYCTISEHGSCSAKKLSHMWGK